MKKLIKVNPQNPEIKIITRATTILKNGGILGYPTETVYGLGADIFNEKAVSRIYQIKSRESHKPIIVIVPSIDVLAQLVTEISPVAEKLIHRFWPGPLTLVFEASPLVPAGIRANGPSIAVRIPDNPVCLALLKHCQTPLTSTSANFSGEPNATTAMMVKQTVGDKLDLILDSGPSRANIPSTVATITNKGVKILRPGAIPADSIREVCPIITD
jgi:L-threonylcarbamoyladenylate synthase